VTLAVTVKPGSKRPGVTLAGESVEVRVAAPALEGRANQAARRALEDALGLPQRDVVLVRGAASRRKVFEIAGLSAADALNRLRLLRPKA